MRPCLCDSDGCRLCFLFHNDSRYRDKWDEKITPAPTSKAQVRKPPGVEKVSLRTLPCVYLSPRVLFRARCQCPREDVHRCDCKDVGGETTQNGRCETCTSYVPDG